MVVVMVTVGSRARGLLELTHVVLLVATTFGDSSMLLAGFDNHRIIGCCGCRRTRGSGWLLLAHVSGGRGLPLFVIIVVVVPTTSR